MSPSKIDILWERRASRELMALPGSERRAVVAAVDGLAPAPLSGTVLSREWKGLRRLRVGRHHLLYAFDGTLLLISFIREARG